MFHLIAQLCPENGAWGWHDRRIATRICSTSHAGDTEISSVTHALLDELETARRAETQKVFEEVEVALELYDGNEEETAMALVSDENVKRLYLGENFTL